MFSAFQTVLTVMFIPLCALFLWMDKKPADKLVIRATIVSQVLVTSASVIYQPPEAMVIIMLIEAFLAWVIRNSHFSHAVIYSILIYISAAVSLIAVLDYVLLGGGLFWRNGEPLIYFGLNTALTIVQLGILGVGAFNGRNRRTRNPRRHIHIYRDDHSFDPIPERRS